MEIDYCYIGTTARGETPANEGPRRPTTAAVSSFNEFPAETRLVIETGFRRCVDFQDGVYGDSYIRKVKELTAIDRMSGGADKGWRLSIEGARFLALRMTYEDVIRVADLKTRADRFETVRKESRAKGKLQRCNTPAIIHILTFE